MGELIAWLDNKPVASFRRERFQQVSCTYLPEAFDLVQQNQPLLSCTLLVGSDTLDATAFCEGLLPEGQHRQNIADMAGVASWDTFAMLQRFGRDIAGAVSFLEPGDTPQTSYPTEELSSVELAELVETLPSTSLGARDDSELSLAGLQDKMLLIKLGEDKWARPKYGAPSTHILKLDHERHRGVVKAEAQALALAKEVGLTNITAEVQRFSDRDCLIVSRFDRETTDTGVVTRIHQEDLCQACGVLPTQKYQLRRGGGGPGLADAAALLDSYSLNSKEQLTQLIRTATFNAIIGNADGHAKNHAFLLRSGAIELAPLYDLVPTVLFAGLTTDSAMSVGAAVSVDAISLGMVGQEAKLWGFDIDTARSAATLCAEELLEACENPALNIGDELKHRIAYSSQNFFP